MNMPNQNDNTSEAPWWQGLALLAALAIIGFVGYKIRQSRKSPTVMETIADKVSPHPSVMQSIAHAVRPEPTLGDRIAKATEPMTTAAENLAPRLTHVPGDAWDAVKNTVHSVHTPG